MTALPQMSLPVSAKGTHAACKGRIKGEHQEVEDMSNGALPQRGSTPQSNQLIMCSAFCLCRMISLKVYRKNNTLD